MNLQNSKKIDIPLPSEASFIELVRRGMVSAPIYKSFSTENWRNFHQSHRKNRDCDKLFYAGIIIFNILFNLRCLYDEISAPLDLNTHIRSLVGVGNREARVLAEMMREQVENETSESALNDIAQFKVTVSGGSKHGVEEISQMTVDALTKAVGERLRETAPMNGNLRLGGLSVFSLEVNICGSYRLVESLWQDCLWNGYALIHGSNGEVIAAPIGEQSTFDVAWRVISEYRREMLRLHKASFLYKEFNKLNDSEKIVRVPYRLVVHPGENCSTAGFCFANANDARALDTAKEAFFTLSGLRPEYYEDLLDQTQSKLGGGTLRELTVAWLAIRSISIAESANHIETDIESEIHLSEFSKIYNREELVNAISIALASDSKKAEVFVEFMTFRGETKQTLWTHPLIKLPNGHFCMLSLATEHADSTYVLERWMGYLGMNVSKKGNPFEIQVKSRLKAARCSDEIKGQIWVLQPQFKFNSGIPGSRTEEIDLVLTLGSTVILGEVKCSITPTESVDFFNNREIISGAADQIRRKAKAVESGRKVFVKSLAKRGKRLPEDFKIVPVVVVNNPIFVGRDIDGIPVTDLLILERYIEGFLIERARVDAAGNVVPEHALKFYGDLKDAEANILGYLLNPPQLRHLQSGLKPRAASIPINRLIGGPALSYETFETVVDLATVSALQDREATGGVA